MHAPARTRLHTRAAAAPPPRRLGQLGEILLVDRAAARGGGEPLADAVAVEDVLAVAAQAGQHVARRHVLEADGAGVVALLRLEGFGDAAELLLVENLGAWLGREEHEEVVVFWADLACLQKLQLSECCEGEAKIARHLGRGRVECGLSMYRLRMYRDMGWSAGRRRWRKWRRRRWRRKRHDLIHVVALLSTHA